MATLLKGVYFRPGKQLLMLRGRKLPLRNAFLLIAKTRIDK